MECKYPYVVHAEMNAILNKNTASITGAVSLLHWADHALLCLAPALLPCATEVAPVPCRRFT